VSLLCKFEQGDRAATPAMVAAQTEQAAALRRAGEHTVLAAAA
jgi:hypothetical protein